MRAALVVVVAALVAVGVLVRMGATHSSVSHPATTRTAAVSTSTVSATTAPTAVTTSLPPTTVSPSTVTVLVLNGWTTRHAALYFQKKLAADGYDTLAPNNALDETNKTSSIFVVTPADNATGIAISELLGLPSSVVVEPSSTNDSAIPASLLHQADIIVLVGGDISGQVPAGYNG